MKKHIVYLFLFLIIPFSYAREYKYQLTVCAIFRNETRWLPEWIEFHRKQGVEHFYLYDNLSVDKPQHTLQPYIEEGLVDIIPWNIEATDDFHWNTIQCDAYRDCIEKVRDVAKWCAFIDVDEFLFCPDRSSLSTKLNDYKKFSGVGVNWVIYGTSNVENIPDDAHMLDVLTMRAPFSLRRNLFVKCIIRPQYAETFFPSPHVVVYRNKKYKTITENKEPLDIYNEARGGMSVTHSVNVFRINHYWTRDRDFFYNVKLKNRRWTASEEEMINSEKEMNAEYDPILSSF